MCVLVGGAWLIGSCGVVPKTCHIYERKSFLQVEYSFYNFKSTYGYVSPQIQMSIYQFILYKTCLDVIS